MKNLRKYIKSLIKEAMLDPKVFAGDEIPEDMLAGEDDFKKGIIDLSRTEYRSAQELADSLEMMPAPVASAGGYETLRDKGKKIKYKQWMADSAVSRINHVSGWGLKKPSAIKTKEEKWAFGLLEDLFNSTKQKAQDGMIIEDLFDYFLDGSFNILIEIQKIHIDSDIYDQIYEASDWLLEDFIKITREAYKDDQKKAQPLISKQQRDKYRKFQIETLEQWVWPE